MPSAPSPLESLPLQQVLEHVNVPSYVIDATGVIRWLNRAAESIVGDLRGRSSHLPWRLKALGAQESCLRGRS